MLSMACTVRVAVAAPPVLNAGANAGLIAMPIVPVTLPRSTNRYSSFADQPPPSFVSTPAPKVQPTLVVEKLAEAGRNGPGCKPPGKIVELAEPVNVRVSFTVPHARPPVRYHINQLLERTPARARAVPKFVSFCSASRQ